MLKMKSFLKQPCRLFTPAGLFLLLMALAPPRKLPAAGEGLLIDDLMPDTIRLFTVFSIPFIFYEAINKN